MIDETPIQKALQEILETQSFEKLEDYSDHQLWQSMSQDERQLLSHAFTCAGELELKQAKSDTSITTARKFFQQASHICSGSAMVWYRRGRSFMGQSQQALLEEASLCFDKAVSLDPAFFDAWYAWANLLMFLGSLSGDLNYFEIAEEKFKAAHTLIEDKPLESHSSFYWHYGLSWFTIAGSSGEAYDYHMAIHYFKIAKGLGSISNDFLNIFGNSYMSLFFLTNNQEMLYEAIELYLHSLDIDEKEQEPPREIAARYCNLGHCYQYLFELYHEPSFFNQAQGCFYSAIQTSSDCSNAWSSWGSMLLLSSKLWQDVAYLEESVKKFSRAAEFVIDDPLLFSRWAESYAQLGLHEESIQFLLDAQQLSKQALELAPHLPECWTASSVVAYLMGRYYSDQTCLVEACKSAEQGLAVCPLYGALWHSLAVAQFAVGEINDDVKVLEGALDCFLKASTSDVGRLGSFWNDWGIALLTVAEMTNDIKMAQEAVDTLEQAIILQENVHLYWLVNYAMALDLLGDLTDEESLYEKAMEILAHVVQASPENLAARYQLALSASHLAELTSDPAAYEKAIALLKELLQEDPDDEQAWSDLGIAYMGLAELTTESADPSLKSALYEEALQNLMVAAQLGNQHVLYYIACLYSQKGDVTQAIYYFEKAFESDTLPAVEEVLEEDWLEALRNTSYFERFLKRLPK